MRTNVRWHKGISGEGASYTFSPRPTSLIRRYPANRMAKISIPKLNGSIVQTLGINAREVEISGVIYVVPSNYDDLVAKKKALEDGVGTEVGQLHIISNWGQSNSKHIYYKGILNEDGIQWGEQKDPTLIEYRFVIYCADPTEYQYTGGISGYSGYSGDSGYNGL